MKIAVIAGVLLVIVIIGLATRPLFMQQIKTMKCPEDEELKQAALHVLNPILGGGPSYLAFELGYGNPNELDRQAALIAQYRQKVGAMQDPCVRKAYEGWLDFWQNENEAAREEFTTGAKRKEFIQYQKEQATEQERISNRAKIIPRP